jgi:hypothetical protein
VSAADPLELAFRPSSAFQKAGESEELKALRFQHHEQMRQVSKPAVSQRHAVLALFASPTASMHAALALPRLKGTFACQHAAPKQHHVGFLMLCACMHGFPPFFLQERIKALIEERKKLLEGGGAEGGSGGHSNSGTHMQPAAHGSVRPQQKSRVAWHCAANTARSHLSRRLCGVMC